MNELKPCRFCGCDQIQCEVREGWTDPFARYCRNCRMYGPIAKTVEEADKYWNDLNSIDVSIGISRAEAKANIKDFIQEEDGYLSAVYDEIDDIYDSIEPKNVVARYEVEADSDSYGVYIHPTIHRLKKDDLGKTYIVTIQEQP